MTDDGILLLAIALAIFVAVFLIRRYAARAILGALLCWTVQAESIRTIDGDTFIARIEIWPKLYTVETIRVLGVDTPELKGPDRKKALAAKAFTEEWLALGPFIVEVCRRDSFGRALANVTRKNEGAHTFINEGTNLASDLITSKHGRPLVK